MNALEMMQAYDREVRDWPRRQAEKVEERMRHAIKNQRFHYMGDKVNEGILDSVSLDIIMSTMQDAVIEEAMCDCPFSQEPSQGPHSVAQHRKESCGGASRPNPCGGCYDCVSAQVSHGDSKRKEGWRKELTNVLADEIVKMTKQEGTQALGLDRFIKLATDTCVRWVDMTVFATNDRVDAMEALELHLREALTERDLARDELRSVQHGIDNAWREIHAAVCKWDEQMKRLSLPQVMIEVPPKYGDREGSDL